MLFSGAVTQKCPSCGRKLLVVEHKSETSRLQAETTGLDLAVSAATGVQCPQCGHITNAVPAVPHGRSSLAGWVRDTTRAGAVR